MTLIADSAGVAAFCERLRTTKFVTVDTEFMREKTFWSKVCLIQLAGPNEAAAIDPLVTDIELQPLFDLLSDRHILKVMHSGRQDVEIFFHMVGQVPYPLFDTQIAAMVCGFGDQVGYETLIKKLTGHILDKSLRFTDWSVRPLSKRHLTYALADVIYLRQAYEKLRDHLQRTGHAHWLEEETAILTDPNTYRIDPRRSWQRLKTRSEDRRYLAILQAVAAWREKEAMERDVPRGRILRDDALSEIAAHPPLSSTDLARLRSVPNGFARGGMSGRLLHAVRKGQELPLDKAPEPIKNRAGRNGGAITELLKVLLKCKCTDYDVAQRLVASSEEIERLAAGDEDVPALFGWRREVFGIDALRLISGKIALVATGRRIKLIPVNGAGEVDVANTQQHKRRQKVARPGVSAPKTPTTDA